MANNSHAPKLHAHGQTFNANDVSFYLGNADTISMHSCRSGTSPVVEENGCTHESLIDCSCIDAITVSSVCALAVPVSPSSPPAGIEGHTLVEENALSHHRQACTAAKRSAGGVQADHGHIAAGQCAGGVEGPNESPGQPSRQPV